MHQRTLPRAELISEKILDANNKDPFEDGSQAVIKGAVQKLLSVLCRVKAFVSVQERYGWDICFDLFIFLTESRLEQGSINARTKCGWSARITCWDEISRQQGKSDSRTPCKIRQSRMDFCFLSAESRRRHGSALRGYS